MVDVTACWTYGSCYRTERGHNIPQTPSSGSRRPCPGSYRARLRTGTTSWYRKRGLSLATSRTAHPSGRFWSIGGLSMRTEGSEGSSGAPVPYNGNGRVLGGCSWKIWQEESGSYPEVVGAESCVHGQSCPDLCWAVSRTSNCLVISSGIRVQCKVSVALSASHNAQQPRRMNKRNSNHP